MTSGRADRRAAGDGGAGDGGRGSWPAAECGPDEYRTQPPTLADAGIDYKFSARAQVIAAFVAAGAALSAIRDAKLYRETHATFEGYCQERWGLSRPRAYQLIEATGVQANCKCSPPCRASSRTQNEARAGDEAGTSGTNRAPHGRARASKAANPGRCSNSNTSFTWYATLPPSLVAAGP